VSSESINTTNSVAANEYPDMVGTRPTNPRLAAFRPFISPRITALPEMTMRALIMGTLLGIVFGASSLYLVLKVGLTVSASIPVAVISITLFRIFSGFGARNATILENNIVQTAGSAGESIAFGVGVTMPAILILGFDLEITRVMLVAVLGGLLGILMMIPLRRALIVQQHGLLKYPEGTACAEVLKAGASDESRRAAAEGAETEADRAAVVDREAARSGAAVIFVGFGLGLIYQTLLKVFSAWKEVPNKVFGEPLRGGSVGIEVSPALLGVGYIIGPRIAGVMCAGGVLAYLVLIPTIKFFGDALGAPLAPATTLIRDMSPDQVRGEYILYIGAGAVAAGGIISLFRSLPTIWHGLKEGLRDFRGGQDATAMVGASVPRTDQDLSMKFVLGGIIALVAMIMLAPSLQMNLLGALLIIAFGFLFVTVSSRLTGEIGSSSNPISGMTVATLLLTCLIFLALGWTGSPYYVTALSVGAIVCIAASNGGTTSQDLKTGFLVGGTPSRQQIAILIGAFASALILGPILLQLNQNGTVYVPRITFDQVEGESARRVDAGLASTLPVYAEQNFTPPVQGTYRLLDARADAPGAALVPGLASGEYLVNDSGAIAYRVRRNFPAELRANPAQLTGATETLQGAQGRTDANSYQVWQRTETVGGPAGRYLVNNEGVPVYLVDPAINGTHRTRPDGSQVTKFDAPKAVLMSYIIKGILSRELPWGLVLIGAMIAIVLELAGLPSLAFAVGVYLPLSASTPILVGGLVRWAVDRYIRGKFRDRNLTEEELVAEGDKSPGVLLSSGYIAGYAIAGIIFAFVAGLPALESIVPSIAAWSEANNPFFTGINLGAFTLPGDILSLIPFALLVALLYLTGRERLFARGTSR
jgi:putative OPT family oligopeptide transporter